MFLKSRKNTLLNIHVISCGCKTKIVIKLEFDLKEFQIIIKLRNTPKATYLKILSTKRIIFFFIKTNGILS